MGISGSLQREWRNSLGRVTEGSHQKKSLEGLPERESHWKESLKSLEGLSVWNRIDIRKLKRKQTD